MGGMLSLTAPFYACFQGYSVKVVERIYQFSYRKPDSDDPEKIRVKNDKIVDLFFNGEYIKIVSLIKVGESNKYKKSCFIRTIGRRKQMLHVRIIYKLQIACVAILRDILFLNLLNILFWHIDRKKMSPPGFGFIWKKGNNKRQQVEWAGSMIEQQELSEHRLQSNGKTKQIYKNPFHR